MDVVLTSNELWEALRTQVADHGGCVVPIDTVAPSLFSEIPLRFVVGSVPVAEVRGQVVQVFAGAQIALLFDDAARAVVTAARPPRDAATPSAGPETTARPAAARTEEPLWKRYETLTRAEKLHLAKYGSAEERRAVLRDRDSTLHGMVLSNPGCNAQEIATLLKSGQVSGQFVLKVAERRELWQNPAVAEALVFHPLTPIDLAERLVPSLPVEVVRRIAKQGNLRTQVVTAARRRVST